MLWDKITCRASTDANFSRGLAWRDVRRAAKIYKSATRVPEFRKQKNENSLVRTKKIFMYRAANMSFSDRQKSGGAGHGTTLILG
jgi:hypothetical protein